MNAFYCNIATPDIDKALDVYFDVEFHILNSHLKSIASIHRDDMDTKAVLTEKDFSEIQKNCVPHLGCQHNVSLTI